MSSKQYKELIKIGYETMANKMDEREKPISILRDMVDRGVEIPDEYKHMLIYITEPPWRENKKVIRKLKKAARIAAKNEMKKNRNKNG